MYPELLPFLQCPTCSSTPLMLVVGREQDDDVIEGGLKCDRCQHVTAIRDGIVDAIGSGPVPLIPAQIANYLPLAAWGYERLWRWKALGLLSGRRFPLVEELQQICSLVEPERGGLLLDVACSTALYARAFAKVAPGAIVAAVDHSGAMLREARRYAQREGLHISFVRASAQALPFCSASAAGYGMGGSLNEIGDIDATLGEARRVLRRTGRFVSMNLLAAESAWGRLLQRLLSTGGIEFPQQRSLNHRFTAAGLDLVSQSRWRVVEISLLLPRYP
ncbi:MAG TPA: methyltransferase domain-containing protein [Herpetosiphonaceae bacterium]|nr:methyltransferase domain-containing protein [Herpetosiphonaceae bacterium]